MSKREEISEEVVKYIRSYSGELFNEDIVAKLLLEYLHSQGVAIKKESDPEYIVDDNGFKKYYGDMPSEMYEDGYTLTDPLIEV